MKTSIEAPLPLILLSTPVLDKNVEKKENFSVAQLKSEYTDQGYGPGGSLNHQARLSGGCMTNLQQVLQHYHDQMFEVVIPRDLASAAARAERYKKQGMIVGTIQHAGGPPPTLRERLLRAVRAHAEFIGQKPALDLEQLPLKKLYAVWNQMGNAAMRHSRDTVVVDICCLRHIFRSTHLSEVEQS